MANFSIFLSLFTVITFYIRLDDNTLLSLYHPIYISLYTESALMVFFPNHPHNVFLVFPIVKLTVTAKKRRLNKKQVNISLKFA